MKARRIRSPQHRTSSIRRLALRLQLRRLNAATLTRKALSRRKRAFAALSAATALLLWLLVWPFTIAHLQALAVLDLISGKPVPGWLRKVVAEPVRTADIEFATDSGTVTARTYTPIHKPDAPALVVFHGVHHLGINEPRLEAFAAAMASCGIRVLTPQLPQIADYQVNESSVRTIGESAIWFNRQTGGPVGVMGLSFAGGLALVAASDPVYHPAFKFVFAVGAQDSMSRVTEYYRTGGDLRPDGTEERLPAHEYGSLVVEYEHLPDLVPPADVLPIRAVLRAHLYEQPQQEKLAAAALDPRLKAEADALLDSNSPAMRARMAQLEATHIAEMTGLSPHGKLHSLTTPVFLLHGKADNIIPSAETLWMASELPSESLQAVLVSPVLSHLEFTDQQPNTMDQLRLLHFFALVIHATEASSGRAPVL